MGARRLQGQCILAGSYQTYSVVQRSPIHFRIPASATCTRPSLTLPSATLCHLCHHRGWRHGAVSVHHHGLDWFSPSPVIFQSSCTW